MSPPPTFHRLLVANRGEVAVRIARGCDRLGIVPVFAVSEADRDAPYTRGREVVVLGPARSSASYLDAARVVQAAVQTRCSALHPGWGFLSENPLLATLCASHGVTFVGPPPQVMELMGGKSPAKRAMRAAGLAVIPGSDGPLTSAAEAVRIAGEVGYPVILKAESGGGGRGMRVALGPAELEPAFALATAEARAAFGDERVFLERLIEGGRHVEVQVFADRYGHAIHLGERDCTVQRNHQKLIEESPSPILTEAQRAPALAAAVAATRAIGYAGAGTMEMLLDLQGPASRDRAASRSDAQPPSTGAARRPWADGVLRFMEMNTRLQVEHSVSEQRTGVDLVVLQLEAAAGHRLRLAQDEVRFTGHVIECRINAEDPAADFRPAPGRITRWQLPDLQGGAIRVDTHVEQGYVVPPHYDSLICKVIARGDDRADAIARMRQALGELVCEGIPTTIPLHQRILASADFQHHHYDTRHIPGWP
ncbi:MAG TPA: biotin carboxylase N-terminal domain-containing protein [Kofleriaceae bacterium]|nr:biotin carboxylase N-terminal domain-containing protein [Kofleriaceae bacterium]